MKKILNVYNVKAGNNAEEIISKYFLDGEEAKKFYDSIKSANNIIHKALNCTNVYDAVTSQKTEILIEENI